MIGWDLFVGWVRLGVSGALLLASGWLLVASQAVAPREIEEPNR